MIGDLPFLVYNLGALLREGSFCLHNVFGRLRQRRLQGFTLFNAAIDADELLLPGRHLLLDGQKLRARIGQGLLERLRLGNLFSDLVFLNFRRRR